MISSLLHSADSQHAPIQKSQASRFGWSLLSLAFLFFLSFSNIQAQTAASFAGLDSVSKGNWQGKYGADGYSIPNYPQAIPSYALFAIQNQASWTWNNTTSDSRALQIPNASARLASTWFSYSTMSFDLNFTDGQAHQIAVYALDWDGGSRSETLQVLDANSGALLDARTLSNFSNGMYLLWTISGHAKIIVTYNGGSNAALNGVFFGGAVATPSAPPASTLPTSSASLVSIDTATQGNWQAKYGADGYSIPNGTQTVPAYAAFAAQNQSTWTWVNTTTDPRALASANSTRTASTWFNDPSFAFDMNLTDGKSHQIALYALDWDNKSRTETIQILDASSGAILDTRNLSAFSSGIYLVWNLSGHVKINVSMSSGPNATISGIFFGAASSNAATSPVPPVQAATLILNTSSTSLSFGNVNVSSSSNQTVTLTNAGNSNVTISNVTVSGAGFNASGALVGTTLTPGQTALLNATFAPASTGTVNGTITVASNATNGLNVIALSGKAVAPIAHTVSLSWSPSTSTVTGYNVYVSNVSGSGYTKLTSSPLPINDFLDAGLQSSQTRYYVVTSVNSGNLESAFSSEVSAIVP